MHRRLQKDEKWMREIKKEAKENRRKNAIKEGIELPPESDSEDEEELLPDETHKAFAKRVNEYVSTHIQEAQDSGIKIKAKSYKDTLVYQARKDLISEFLKTCVARKKCLNEGCGW